MHVPKYRHALVLFAAAAAAHASAVAVQADAPSAGDAPLAQVLIATKRDAAYDAKSARGATRTDTPLMEVPQAVRVIGAAQIDDLGALRMSDVVDAVSGVARLNDFGGTWDNYAIRGFSSSDMGFLVNGFPGMRGYNPPRDTATVERFEFLKGPAGAVYGSSEPGGTINIVTKKPRFTRMQVADFSIGSRGMRRAALDATGPLGASVAYRLNLMAQEGDGRSPLLHGSRMLFAPALTWKIGAGTTFNYEADIDRADTPLDRGVINVRGALGALPRDRLLNEPSDGKLKLASSTHQFTLDHALSPDWRARIGASYKESTFDGNYTEAYALASDNRTLQRQATWRQLPSHDAALQAELEGRLRTGAVVHTLLLGTEASRLWMNTEILRSANYPLDIHAPVHGRPAPPLTALTSSSDERQRVEAFFAQDQLSLSRTWKLLAGLRRDGFSQSLVNRVARTTTSRSQHALSPRIGVTYVPDGRNSLYVSAGSAFRGNAGTDIDGKAFEPQRSTAYEAGWKFQTLDERLGATVAAYDIRKRNVLTASDVPGYSTAAGEVKSTGLEVDVNGRFGSGWRVMANYALDHARVTKDNVLAPGTRLANVPRSSGGIQAIHEEHLGGGAYYGIGAGANHVGNRSGNNADTYSLPAYATFRLLGYWQMSERLRLSLDVNNLFDRTYYVSSWGNLYVMPGAARNIVLKLKLAL